MTRNRASAKKAGTACLPRKQAKMWDNRSGPGGAINTTRSLTHSLDYGKEGLAMNATRNVEKNCAICATPLPGPQPGRGGYQPRRKYCSPECKRAAANVKPYVPVKCPSCEKDRIVKNVRQARGSRCRSCAAELGSKRAAEILLAVPPKKRIEDNIRVGENSCWEWMGTRQSNGYGALHADGRTVRAHRYSYEAFVGPIPRGLQIDHLCRNRACVNPKHLEPVTARENARRAMRSHCVNGHQFSEENTWVYKGKRYCRECRRIRVREYQERKRRGA